MKLRYISALVALGCISFLVAHGVSVVNNKYTTERMSSPQMEQILPANEGFMTKLEYYIEGYPKPTQVPITTTGGVTQQMSVIQKDYEDAHNQCSSVAGWIKIPGTDINYPVDYNAKDNNYYLHHNWDNKPYWNGTPYIDSADKGYQNWTLINGHDMLNGIIFAQLLKYENLEFAKSNPYIYLYEGLNINKEVKFEIVGATYVPDAVDFSLGNLDKEQSQTQINNLLSKPIYTLNNYNGGKVLMLNTCLSNGTDNHLLLIAQEVSS